MKDRAEGARIVAGKRPKLVFASDTLPSHLDDSSRFAAFRDYWSASYGLADVERLDDRPFRARLEFAPLGGLGVGRFEGTMRRVLRTPPHAAREGVDEFLIGLNLGPSRMTVAQNGRTALLGPGMATIISRAEANSLDIGGDNSWLSLNVPRRRLLESVAGAEDLLGVPLGPVSQPLMLLARYLGILGDPAARASEPAVIAHIETTLLDLAALALGAARDAAELARMRGLRAARLQLVVAALKAGFANPAFTSRDVARALGISRRYVNDLLHESGAGFAERVMELRLQKARSMLADRRSDQLRIGEIAYRCGFNEASYFNRCFRRRFGAAPGELRRHAGADD